VEELLKGLLGGLFENDEGDVEDGNSRMAIQHRAEHADRNWKESTETLCGWPREVLLKEVILALGKIFHTESS
jgi:protein HIRA/HIR1